MVPIVSQHTQALFETNDGTKPETISVMVTNASTIEEQLEEMKRMLAEKDAQIAALTSQLAAMANISDHKSDEKSDHEKGDREKNIRGHGIREVYTSSNPQFSGYLKPYPAHYDALPFPKGYQKPTFDKFDGVDGSPHEHLAHFFSACGETSQLDALLVRQFVQSLKGAAFTWYSQLQPGSILTWDDMQRAFLAQFVSSKNKVSIIDLADTKQESDESTNEFISRWRSLNLQCSEKLTELSAVQMCSNNLLPHIATFVSTAEPQTFEALVSKASNVERQVARKKIMTQRASFKDHRVDNTDESLATFVETDTKSNKCKGKEGSRKFTLKERKEVKYSFDDDDVEQIFSELNKARVIEPPEPKRQSEVNKTNDPRYCQYHRIVSHPTKDCFV
ncbi:uncharacterized protein LOC133716689 [Rosa rugosa]|uniref:uncharacterized protein LOC133716689 n=1 Tax=Rosa rugosa TaxID=74645 RepID=UPI002B403824|nr:uncharacterized protein LOC133716689 [Rosa rugosa]